MGNCQAIDAAALVIQHPCQRIERLYFPVTASEVMRMNPGHYVSLIIPLPVEAGGGHDASQNDKDREKVRYTRVKLLHPSETLTLGHAYRLVPSQGIMLQPLLEFIQQILQGINNICCITRICKRHHMTPNLSFFNTRVVSLSFFPSLLALEVMKVLRAKRHAKMKQQQQQQSAENPLQEESSSQTKPEDSDREECNQVSPNATH